MKMNYINKIIITIALTISYSLSAEPPFFPMEAFSCNYNKAKDVQDYLDVAEDWNEYADEVGMAYNSWILTPHYFSTDYDNEVYWIGFAPTWKQMAEAQDAMTVGEGAKLNDRFFKVVDCDSHSAAPCPCPSRRLLSKEEEEPEPQKSNLHCLLYLRGGRKHRTAGVRGSLGQHLLLPREARDAEELRTRSFSALVGPR